MEKLQKEKSSSNKPFPNLKKSKTFISNGYDKDGLSTKLLHRQNYQVKMEQPIL